MSFTLNKIKRDLEQDNLYDLTTQTYIDLPDNIQLYETYVSSDENMRLDLISLRIFGSSKYIEELMQINNILNIWNIKEGDKILYSSIDSITMMQKLEVEVNKLYKLNTKQNKNTRIDSEKKGFVPVVKSKNFESVSIDTKGKKIKIQGKIS